MLNMLFSAEGRINRAQFWGYGWGSLFAYMLIMWGLISAWNEILINISFAVYIPFLWTYFVLYIKRLHDLDKSGWMSLLLLVPIAFFYPMIVWHFFKGTTGKNQFGEDPLGWTTINNTEKVVEL